MARKLLLGGVALGGAASASTYFAIREEGEVMLDVNLMTNEEKKEDVLISLMAQNGLFCESIWEGSHCFITPKRGVNVISGENKELDLIQGTDPGRGEIVIQRSGMNKEGFLFGIEEGDVNLRRKGSFGETPQINRLEKDGRYEWKIEEGKLFLVGAKKTEEHKCPRGELDS